MQFSQYNMNKLQQNSYPSYVPKVKQTGKTTNRNEWKYALLKWDNSIPNAFSAKAWISAAETQPCP